MKVPSTKLQNNFGKYLKYVEVNEEIIITKKGKDVARILPCHGQESDTQDSEMVMEGATDYKTTDGWVTYEQFMELVEGSEQRFELIDGVVYNLASPSYGHQLVVHEIHGVFYNWFKGKKCVPLTSPFDVTFFKHENNICVVQPDIIVVCDKDNMDKKGRYKGIPTLVVEVLSISTRSKDMLKKLDLYKQCGVNEYWIVDPKSRLIYLYSLDQNEIVDNSAFSKSAHECVESIYFPGLKVILNDIFE